MQLHKRNEQSIKSSFRNVLTHVLKTKCLSLGQTPMLLGEYELNTTIRFLSVVTRFEDLSILTKIMQPQGGNFARCEEQI